MAEEDDPPSKRPRLFFDDDKENEMDVEDHYHHQQAQENLPTKASSSLCKPVDDAQEILRDLYETCVSEGITSRSASYSDTFFCAQPQQQQTFSLSLSASCNVSSSLSNTTISSNNSSTNSCNNACDSDWLKHPQYPFNCGHSSLLGNDLQSVVFHSLITSLES